jgi:hypothetical protein
VLAVFASETKGGQKVLNGTAICLQAVFIRFRIKGISDNFLPMPNILWQVHSDCVTILVQTRL